MQKIYGCVEKITFQNTENGFTVAKLNIPSSQEFTSIVGIMPGLQAGESISATGTWLVNPQHGRQFQVSEYQVKAPSSLYGIRKYLESGLIKGIGPTYAKRIVAAFKLDTLHIIDQFPERLGKIPGIGEKRMETIKNCWEEQKSIRDVMIFLQSHSVSPAFAQKIFKVYKQNSIIKVQENPYNLSRDVIGIGFKIADSIAKKMGFSQNSEKRIDAGIEYVLSELAEQGHTCYPLEKFQPIARDVLKVEQTLIEAREEYLQIQDRIVLAKIIHEGIDTEFIWLKPLYACEMGIGREIHRLRESPDLIRSIHIEKAIDWVQKQIQIELECKQVQAIELALKEKFLLVTGGPGTGKSTITNAILTIMQFLTEDIILTAPTGRAAKRMSEITKRDAKTIHSLLEYEFKTRGFRHNKNNPLKGDLIIIDEASMIDTYLMYHLLKALPNEMKVIFIGDANQLPSIGPGNILRDMIQCMRLPTIELTEIFRQSSGSSIISGAHQINRGILPEIQNLSGDDFFFIEAEEKERVLDNIIHLISSRIPKKYNFRPFEDIQILSPMKKGIIGTENLNHVMQKILNPKETGIQRLNYRFCEGDKIMQIRNNYRKEVFNGDIGKILHIDHTEQETIVEINGKNISYNFRDLDEIVLSYAVSVHKYQGSECPCIIMPVHTTHYKLLQRNLLYTAITRGKKLVILIGTKKALRIAIQNNEVKKRYTSLQQSLLAMPTVRHPLFL